MTTDYYCENHSVEPGQCLICGSMETKQAIDDFVTPQGEDLSLEKTGWLECEDCNSKFPDTREGEK